MKHCERYNKKRCFIERLLSTDKALCEECPYDLIREGREKTAVPIWSRKRREMLPLL